MKVTPKHYIGGDFQIDPQASAKSAKAVNSDWVRRAKYNYSAGRFAMLAAIDFAARTGCRILIPDYLCEAQVEILKAFAIPFEFYRLTPNLFPDLNSIRDRSAGLDSEKIAILAINYFGLIDLERVALELRSVASRALLIADNVQAPFDLPSASMYPFVYTSFRKFVAVPDGAELITEHAMRLEPTPIGPAPFVAKKLEAAFEKYRYVKADVLDHRNEAIYIRRYADGETVLDESKSLETVSDQTLQILTSIDLAKVSAQRIANYSALAEGLKDLEIELPTLNGNTPLCVPLLIDDRDFVRSEMRSAGIFAPVHWPSFADLPETSTGRTLSRHEMGLIIDQRYVKTDMLRQLSALEHALLKKPNLKIVSLI